MGKGSSSVLPVGQSGVAGEPNYLKLVSRIKHEIYSNYLAAWISILSRSYRRLRVFDCFAGDGRYVNERGEPLPGSPQLAISITSDIVDKSSGLAVAFGFIEHDPSKAERLRIDLDNLDCTASITRSVFGGDAEVVTRSILKSLRSKPGTVPTFFFLDPYGHPLPIPLLRELIAIPKAEVLVNLMWFRISMDLANPDRTEHLDYLFGHDKWREQRFNQLSGPARETAFVEYFEQEVNAPYRLHQAMPYSPEDKVGIRDTQTKYYLVHFSSHPSAANAMKPVMKRAEKALARLRGTAEQMPFDFADPRKESIAELKSALCDQFGTGKQLSFGDLLDDTANMRNVEPEFRKALKELELEGKIKIDRRESKRDGLNHGDVITFDQMSEGKSS
jgi:three-Cys-motif partner protein